MSQNLEQQSNESTVVRKFEELRQSIQINNSISQMRMSNSQKKNQSGEENEQLDGNKNVHQNSFVLDTKNIDIETEKYEFQKKEHQTFNKHLKQSKDDKAKEELSLKVDHKISLEELRQKYQTDYSQGLTQDAAIQGIQKYGENKLTEKKKISIWVKLFKELTNGFAIMLWVGTGLCFLAYGLSPDDPSNLYLAIVLIIVILITTSITFQQNSKSEALMNSFKNFLPQKCVVLRNGEIQSIEAVTLIPGDVVFIKSGEKIPADIRILESSEMKVDNSPLTGESEPLLRTVECTHPDNYLETTNIAFFGTLCKEGQGKGVVIAIGDNTTLGKIADLSSGEKKTKTPLRSELDRFVIMITIIAIILGIIFFLLALFSMGYPILTCIVFGIGILVANVPEGLLGCVTISLAITAKNLTKKSVLVKNLESVETLGSTSCICSDKTGTLTQNVMSVRHMWYKNKIFNIKNMSLLQPGELPDYDMNDLDFKTLHQAAMISSEARFDISSLADPSQVDFMKCKVIGDATETGLIRFYQYVEDVNSFRDKFQITKNSDGTIGKMPFNSQVKFALTIVEEPIENSFYTIYMKGAPEKIWSFCNTIIHDGKAILIDAQIQNLFKEVNLQFGKGGERVLGFAKMRLPIINYPKGTTFIVSSVAKFNFKLANFEFCGLISLMDPPKTRVPTAILECRSAGIKVIMVTGDQPPTAAAIAKEVNIIPKKVITNEDLLEADPNLDWFEASEKCEAIIVHGDKIVESIDKSLGEHRNDEFFYLKQWVKKPYCVFARTTPAQKLQIVTACQQEGFIVAATGDGVNDSPAIKQADIGVSMNLSGSDVTKDAADMILLDDDFASIVNGVEEGRKIFDNLKKTIVYLLTSNMTEIIPFLALIIVQIPLPLSSIYMLVICVGTDILPAISLAYEEAELDIMTRKPRTKNEHLVSAKLITIAYLQMGFIATAGGFLGYYTSFNYFGFPVIELFGMASISGYYPPPKDFSDYNGNPSFNSQLDALSEGDCNKVSKADLDALRYQINWFKVEEGKYDLRKALVKCDTESGKWVSDQITWSFCNTDSPLTYTKIIGHTACYSTDAIRWAQSVYFVCVVFVQWSNIFACKSRKMSFTTSAFNPIMIYGIIFETCLMIFLLFVPGVQNVFGGRPLPFWQIGMPAFSISIFILLWDETRKFLTRTFKWFLKYCLW